MSYHNDGLVEGPDYPALKKRQQCVAWVSARAHLRRAALDVPSVICVYGAEVDEDTIEAAVLAETGMNTPWIRYTLDEIVARLKEGLPTYHEETHAPAEEADVPMATTDVPMAPAEAPALADEISQAHEFLNERFACA